MKREALGCTKMKRLCQKLGVPQYVAVGILESLWHLTAKEAPQGDIGKLSNDDIALGLDWKGDPDEMIAALIQSRWLDEQDGVRLIVHDWHLHCEDTIDVRLARNGLGYASGNLPRMNKLSEKERGGLCAKFSWKSENGAFVRTKSHKKALPVPKPLPLPVPKPLPLSPETLEEIYEAYPKRVAKGAALPAIEKALRKSEMAPAEMLALVTAYALQRIGDPKHPEFTPNPATWFNQGRYLDETLQPKQKLIWEAVDGSRSAN